MATKDISRRGLLGKTSLYKRATTEDLIIDVIIYLGLIFISVLTVYPFLNTLAYSLNDATDSIRGSIYIWPRMFTLRSYEQILLGNPYITRAMFNSASRALLGGTLNVFSTLCVAYVFSRREFFLRKVFTPFLVFTMYFSGGLIPSFILIRDLGLMSNYLVYILPGMLSAYNVMVMRSYIEGIPDSLVEAARIDGASEYRICFRLIFPLALPAVATITLIVAVHHWNSWFDTMLYCSSEPKLTTLQYELQKLMSSAQALSSTAGSESTMANAGEDAKAAVTAMSIRTAMTIIAVVPILFIYPFLQKYFVKGLTIGGVKG